MTIKYGEFTFINNESSMVESMLDTLTSWITNEQQQKLPNNYIFLFEDGEICEWDNTCKDFKFYFCTSYISVLPLYFKEINKQNTYFHTDNLNFDSLFHSYSKYEPNVHVKSNFNGIYYCYNLSLEKPEIFGIKRIPSTDYMPRYQFAYDINEFTKEKIIYLIHHLFT
jgi:hypothetical protein